MPRIRRAARASFSLIYVLINDVTLAHVRPGLFLCRDRHPARARTCVCVYSPPCVSVCAQRIRRHIIRRLVYINDRNWDLLCLSSNPLQIFRPDLLRLSSRSSAILNGVPPEIYIHFWLNTRGSFSLSLFYPVDKPPLRNSEAGIFFLIHGKIESQPV